MIIAVLVAKPHPPSFHQMIDCGTLGTSSVGLDETHGRDR